MARNPRKARGNSNESDTRAGDPRRACSIRFSDSEWRPVEDAALRQGIPAGQFVRSATLAAAEERLDRPAEAARLSRADRGHLLRRLPADHAPRRGTSPRQTQEAARQHRQGWATGDGGGPRRGAGLRRAASARPVPATALHPLPCSRPVPHRSPWSPAMGSSREARCASWKPKNGPAAAPVPRPLATDMPKTRNSRPVKRRNRGPAAGRWRRDPVYWVFLFPPQLIGTILRPRSTGLVGRPRLSAPQTPRPEPALAVNERRRQSWRKFELRNGFGSWCCAPRSPFQR